MGGADFYREIKKRESGFERKRGRQKTSSHLRKGGGGGGERSREGEGKGGGCSGGREKGPAENFSQNARGWFSREKKENRSKLSNMGKSRKLSLLPRRKKEWVQFLWKG